MINNKFCSAVLLAGGTGSRMQMDVKKQFYKINNKPVFVHSLEKFDKIPEIDEIVVVFSESEFNEMSSIDYGISKKLTFAKGGERRQDSSYNGIIKTAANSEIVLIHDSVRPLVKIEDIKKVIADGEKYKAATLAVKAKDTVKIGDENGFFTESPNRNNVYIIQTPQVFSKKELLEAFDKINKTGESFTDETTLIESVGIRAKATLGSYDNIKITTPDDLNIVKLNI
ncbi:MAG: 2-C-methyl-D-erythritol 4-phosphate cytidylyltransferase [Clostridia bacterium]|nr:2-C-methyl-D-erythritol 4-phosphate cytidylyltransferase [Clostridia bacterium]